MGSCAVDNNIASKWRELQGKHSWNGLLDPLDIDLRRSIINYGELAQATYDGFNCEERSPHAGACMYGYDDLLTSSTVTNPGHYQVTKFIYATSGLPLPRAFLLLPEVGVEDAWCRESNFMGYVAVATDEGVAALGRRDIVVAWRGTIRPLEWANDVAFLRVPAAPVLGYAASSNKLAWVHRGFLSLYMSSDAQSRYNKTSARDQVLEELRRLMEKYKDEETSITVTGHSLGGALTALNAIDIVSNRVNVPPNSSRLSCPVTAVQFASPRVGNISFKKAFRSFGDLRALHVMNLADVVPKCPPIATLYMHVGERLVIRSILSPYLRHPCDIPTCHNLECNLHIVAGYQGSAGGFRLEVDRDLALVNKSSDALTCEYPVPACWWVVRNKGMVKDEEGKWVLNDFQHI